MAAATPIHSRFIGKGSRRRSRSRSTGYRSSAPESRSHTTPSSALPAFVPSSVPWTVLWMPVLIRFPLPVSSCLSTECRSLSDAPTCVRIVPAWRALPRSEVPTQRGSGVLRDVKWAFSQRAHLMSIKFFSYFFGSDRVSHAERLYVVTDHKWLL
jgi:hypothetical protein